MKNLNIITLFLLIAGGLNAGLAALIGLDIIGSVLGIVPVLPRILYIVIGAAAVYQLLPLIKSFR